VTFELQNKIVTFKSVKNLREKDNLNLTLYDE